MEDVILCSAPHAPWATQRKVGSELENVVKLGTHTCKQKSQPPSSPRSYGVGWVENLLVKLVAAPKSCRVGVRSTSRTRQLARPIH